MENRKRNIQMKFYVTEEEKRLIIRRYFYRDTQTEIAKDMGISQVQVSRMESRLIEKLRKQAQIEA